MHVILSLIRSHAVLAIKSPAAASSEWVKLEMRIAAFLRIPILQLDSQDLVLLHGGAHRHSPLPPQRSLVLSLALPAAR